jgi:glutamate dehydrogenase/leucine dehydrogenase
MPQTEKYDPYKEMLRVLDFAAVSDVKGGLYCEKGLNIFDVLAYYGTQKTLKGYQAKGVTEITNRELLELDVDILVPAAMENQITEEIARNVKVKIVVEGANGPTTTEADEILNDKDVVIVPDILANAGGVVVSYFEWVQNLRPYSGTSTRCIPCSKRSCSRASGRCTSCPGKTA